MPSQFTWCTSSSTLMLPTQLSMIETRSRRRILLGSGRSGTTWVLDSLATVNNLRPIFEPLHEAESKLGSRYAYDVLAPGDHCPALKAYFLELAQGHIHSRWIDYRGDRLKPSRANFASIRAFRSWIRRWRKYYRDRSELLSSSNRPTTLIKCIRANLMAGWLAQDLGFNTAHIIRHPCAVVESQFRIGRVWNPDPVIARYRSNARLHEVTDGRYLPLLNSNLTRLQALTLNWVIENQRPVACADDEGYAVFCYEHLRHSPATAWKALCASLALTTVPSAAILEAPSQTTSTRISSAGHSINHKATWRRALSPDQLAEVQEILDATECNLYNVSDEMPRQSRPVGE
jgi:hypothetical protein